MNLQNSITSVSPFPVFHPVVAAYKNRGPSLRMALGVRTDFMSAVNSLVQSLINGSACLLAGTGRGDGVLGVLDTLVNLFASLLGGTFRLTTRTERDGAEQDERE